MHILVVGAGLAGLACAQNLRRAGHHVQVLEASDRPGGRIGSLRTPDGYLVDRGFQLLLTRYPSVQALLDLPALRPCAIDSGALVRWGERSYELDNPVANPLALLRTLRAPFVSTGDKLLIGRLTLDVSSQSSEQLLDGPPLGPTRDYIARLGFSRDFTAAFLRPFFGSTFLNRDMGGDARLFRFYWKLMATGASVLPEGGMQAVPDQLAARLGAGALRYGVRVDRLLGLGGRTRGVRLDSGETIEADAVVLATPFPETRRLAALDLDLPGNPVAGLAYAVDTPPCRARKVILNGNPGSLVNLVCPISNVNPRYAPAGRHQLVVQVLGPSPADDEALDQTVRADLAHWFPERDTAGWRLLRVFRVPYGQFCQAPALMARRPGPRLGDRLYLASEVLVQSSIEGALRGGLLAAQALLQDVSKLAHAPR